MKIQRPPPPLPTSRKFHENPTPPSSNLENLDLPLLGIMLIQFKIKKNCSLQIEVLSVEKKSGQPAFIKTMHHKGILWK